MLFLTVSFVMITDDSDNPGDSEGAEGDFSVSYPLEGGGSFNLEYEITGTSPDTVSVAGYSGTLPTDLMIPQTATDTGSYNIAFFNAAIVVSEKVTPEIAQSDTYGFVKGQRLSDIDADKYVTVTPDIDGTFAWEYPETVLDTIGPGTARIIFTPTDTGSYDASSIDADIVVTAPEPDPPGPSGGDNTMLIIAVVAVIAAVGLVAVWFLFLRSRP